MARAEIAGMTDYSHQSLDDILEDLGNWIESLHETQGAFHRIINELMENGYWDNVFDGFQILIGYALKFHETAEKELKEILEEIISDEIQSNHITRLKSISTTADKLNKRYGQVWHQEYKFKDYRNPNFKRVERLYARGRDMVATLELSSLVVRLEDFIGKKGKVTLSDKIEKKEFVPNMPSIEDIQRLIRERFRYLQKLREQEARMGVHAPPHVLTGIEDTQDEINRLEAQLKELEASSNTPKPQIQTKQENLVRTLLSVEIDQNLNALRKFWERANKPQEHEAHYDLDTLHLRLASRLADLRRPHWNNSILESQLLMLPHALSEGEIRRVYDLRDEIGAIADFYSKIVGSDFRNDKVRILAFWQELDELVNQVLEKGNPLTELSENALKVLEAFMNEEKNRHRTRTPGRRGIAGDLKLTEQVVEEALQELKVKDLAIPPKPNSKRWDLTSKGKRRLGL